MITRTLSGIIGGSLVIAALIFNNSFPIVINLMIALVCILSTYEIFSVIGKSEMLEILIPSMIFSAILPLFGYGGIWRTVWYIYTLILFCFLIIRHKYLNFKDIAMIYSLTLLITFSLSTIINIRNWSGKYSTFYVLFTLCVAWMSDTGAYFIGTLFGKRKLFPEISPKKTIEGVFGGIITCICVNLIIASVFKIFIFTEVSVNYFNIVFISFVGSIISVIGDLCFSLIKRACNKKDFGTVIPGHGGILDRFDSVIFVAPFVYLIVHYLNIFNTL